MAGPGLRPQDAVRVCLCDGGWVPVKHHLAEWERETRSGVPVVSSVLWSPDTTPHFPIFPPDDQSDYQWWHSDSDDTVIVMMMMNDDVAPHMSDIVTVWRRVTVTSTLCPHSRDMLSVKCNLPILRLTKTVVIWSWVTPCRPQTGAQLEIFIVFNAVKCCRWVLHRPLEVIEVAFLRGPGEAKIQLVSHPKASQSQLAAPNKVICSIS